MNALDTEDKTLGTRPDVRPGPRADAAVAAVEFTAEVPSEPQLDAQLAGLKFDANGLIPAIVQDGRTGQVLMMAWMNRESLAHTVATGKTHFFSRSRNKLWLKGESSGHVQNVQSIATDCDKDVLLVKVEQVGAACHEGYESCFFREHQPGEPDGDWKVVGDKVFDPDKVYGG